MNQQSFKWDADRAVMSAHCSIGDCDGPIYARGWCRRHYYAWYTYGSPIAELSTRKGAIAKWLAEHVAYSSDACLIWPFARHSDGRAHMKGGYPSRVMCEMAHGPAPTPAHQAAHSCGNGNGGCVSPRHLRWATPTQNAADKIDHGTIIRGEKHHGARLTLDLVKQIKAAWPMSKVEYEAFAARHGVAPSTVYQAGAGWNWKWV